MPGAGPEAGAGLTEGLDLEGLDWVALRKDMKVAGEETASEKLKRKISDNPFVPIGAFATVTALSLGLYNFRTGNAKMSQTMMRARIAAQGFTVVALIVGVMATSKTLTK